MSSPTPSRPDSLGPTYRALVTLAWPSSGQGHDPRLEAARRLRVAAELARQVPGQADLLRRSSVWLENSNTPTTSQVARALLGWPTVPDRSAVAEQEGAA